MRLLTSFHCRRWRTVSVLLDRLLVFWAVSICFGPALSGQEQVSSGHLRIGIATSMFADQNENDAKLFLKVWTENMARKLTLKTDSQPVMLNGPELLENALAKSAVDCAAMTTMEFLSMNAKMQNGPLLLPVMTGSSREEYLILVHRDSTMKTVKDLAGHSLNIFDHPRACLAPMWLEVLLAQEGLGSMDKCFGKINYSKKTSQAVLSVFFRQVEVSLATRSTYNMAVELNPQLGKKLLVLASSPEYVQILYCFRPDYPVCDRNQVLSTIASMHDTPSGQQLQTVFKVDRLEEHSLDCLDNARELLARHKKLKQTTAADQPLQNNTSPP